MKKEDRSFLWIRLRILDNATSISDCGILNENEYTTSSMADTIRLAEDDYVAEFCGFFPAEKPQYTILVSINKKGLPVSGGQMAGSVFKQIVDYMVAP